MITSVFDTGDIPPPTTYAPRRDPSFADPFGSGEHSLLGLFPHAIARLKPVSAVPAPDLASTVRIDVPVIPGPVERPRPDQTARIITTSPAAPTKPTKPRGPWWYRGTRRATRSRAALAAAIEGRSAR